MSVKNWKKNQKHRHQFLRTEKGLYAIWNPVQLQYSWWSQNQDTSFFSSMSKVFVVTLLEVVLSHIQNSDIINPFQLGFREAYSTTHQIFRFNLSISSILLIKSSNLANHIFKDKVQNRTSSSKNIITGVPQDSALGPFLFNLYMNDIPKPLHHNCPIRKRHCDLLYPQKHPCYPQ